MLQYTDEYLMSLSDKESLKLNRKDRRRRDALLKKSNKKTGLSSVDNSTSDKITISKAELRRLIDQGVKEKVESLDETKNRVFSKITFDMFYIVIYTMWTKYNFGPKRMTDFAKNLFDVYVNTFDGDSSIQEVRESVRDRFKISIFEDETDENDNLLSRKELKDAYNNLMKLCGYEIYDDDGYPIVDTDDI